SQKQSDAAKERRPIPDRREKHAPGRWHEIAMQTRYDDDKSFEPHPEIDGQRNDKESNRIAPNPRRPKRLRHQYIEEHQRPENPAVRPKRAIGHHVLVENVAAVPRHERLD